MARNWWDDLKEYGARVHNERYYLARHFVRGTVLDAACGYGTGAQILADMCDKITAVDGDDQGIRQARERNRFKAVVKYQQADLYDMAYPTVDWVVSLETVEHLEHYDRFLKSIQAVAREGIVLSTPIRGRTNPEKGNYHLFTADEIESWFPGDQWRQIFKGYPRERLRDGVHPVYYLGVWKKRPQDLVRLTSSQPTTPAPAPVPGDIVGDAVVPDAPEQAERGGNRPTPRNPTS